MEKCIPAPPNDHLLLERVVTFRTTDRLSETSPCRGKKKCNHGLDGKRDDDAAGSVVAARSFNFGAALDGNVVSARVDAKGGSGACDEAGRGDTASGASVGAVSADDNVDDLYERAQRESAFRSQKKIGLPGGATADNANDSVDLESSASFSEVDSCVDGAVNEVSDESTSKKKNSASAEGKTSTSKGKGGIPSKKGDGGKGDRAKGSSPKGQSKLLSKVDPTSLDGNPQKPPLKMVLMAAAIGIFVIAAACFTFLKPNAGPQQAQPANTTNSNFSSSNFPTQPSGAAGPELAGMMPNVAGNWKVQVVFSGPNGQPVIQEFIASVRQSNVAIEGRGADSNGAFAIAGTISVNQPHTIEFQKAYDANNSAALPINFRGEIVDDQLKIGFGQCVMRIARGGGVLARARSDMLEGSWSAERTTQSAAPASQSPQPSGSNVTAILGVLLAVGVSVFMFMKQKGSLISKGAVTGKNAVTGKKAAADEPEHAADDR